MVLDNKLLLYSPTHPSPTHHTYTYINHIHTFNHRRLGHTHTHTHVDMWGNVAGGGGMWQGWGHVEVFRPTVGMA